MPHHQNRGKQYGERAECHKNRYMRASRDERQHIAGVRAEETEVGRQDGLIANLDFEVFDGGHNDADAKNHDAGGPEPVEQHKQHEVQQRHKQYVEHEYEVAIGPHLAYKAESDRGAG